MTSSRIEAVWDVGASEALSHGQRDLLLRRLGPAVRAVAQDARSQLRNRELALERLRDRVAEALRVDPPRRPTRPTHGSKIRRLDSKRRAGERKSTRRRPSAED